MRDIIQIFSPLGSGKGTQAKILELTGLFKQISTGDLFSIIKENMEPKELAEEMIRIDLQGEYYSDDLAVSVFRYELDKTDKIVIADGIPRTGKQVQMLNGFTNTRFIFNLLVPDRICDYRIKERSENAVRANERDPQVRANRLEVFYKKAEPILALYSPHIIIDIDGTRSTEYVSKRIRDTINHSNLITK
jgi:adenylate kinase